MITIGFRPKTGWTTVVLLGGTAKAPRLFDTRVLELCDPDEQHSRQPYHATFGVEQTDRAIIARLVRGVERISRNAIASLLREYAKLGYRPRRAAIVASSLTDPAGIANQHMRAHASEGLLYRRVVADALARAGITTTVILERDVYARLGKTKGAVAMLGADAPRWRAEEKVAAAAAWSWMGRR